MPSIRSVSAAINKREINMANGRCEKNQNFPLKVIKQI